MNTSAGNFRPGSPWLSPVRQPVRGNLEQRLVEQRGQNVNVLTMNVPVQQRRENFNFVYRVP